MSENELMDIMQYFSLSRADAVRLAEDVLIDEEARMYEV